MDIIRLNNIAASALSSGKQDDAVYYFQKALSTLREIVNSDMDRDESPPCSCKHHSPSVSIAATHDGGHFASSSPVVENAFEFYDKVFWVDFEGCCCQRELDRTQNMLLAVISKFLAAYTTCLLSSSFYIGF